MATENCEVPGQNGRVIHTIAQESKDGVNWAEMDPEKAKCLALAEPHTNLCKHTHMSSVDDNLIIPEKGLFLIKNRTTEPFEVKKGRSYAKINLVRPGSKLVKMDAEIQKDYNELDIDGLIKSEAPTGLQFGELSKTDAHFDSSYEKTVPGQFGLTSVKDDTIVNKPDQIDHKIVTIYYYKNGIKESIDLRIGSDVSAKDTKRFAKVATKYSDLFHWEGIFPFLRNPVTGEPIDHSLQIRGDAIIRNNPTVIKLPPDHERGLTALIDKKLKDGTFCKIPRSNAQYCSPVTVVPKAIPNKDGSPRWRLVQSLINVSENSLHINFKLESPKSLVEKLPNPSNTFSFFDSVSSFDSLKLCDQDIKFTGFIGPDPDAPGTFTTIGSARFPQCGVDV